jgi:hypothetical protein
MRLSDPTDPASAVVPLLSSTPKYIVTITDEYTEFENND